MARFLVTGGAGFIGSHIVERLLKDGHFVRVLDNFSSGKHENLSFVQGLSPQYEGTVPDPDPLIYETPKGTVPKVNQNNTKGTVPTFELIEGDIRDKSTCDIACRGIDYVLHQAALRSVPKSLEDPESYNDVNINGTLFILQAALKNKVKRFVFASSSSIYGDADIFPQKEERLPKLISPYALTKLSGEYYCCIFSENFGLETVSLRYFNVFGPRQALDDEYAVVIPKFINCMLNDQPPPVHGTGKQSRDFTYIDNVVQANILAATKGLSPQYEGTVPDTLIYEAPKGTVPEVNQNNTKGTVPKVSHEVFNVAYGKDQSILDLVDTLNKIIYPVRKKFSNGRGKSIEPVFTPSRPGDVFRTLADISKAERLLGYSPKINFEEGLRKTVEWFEKQQVSIHYNVGLKHVPDKTVVVVVPAQILKK